VSVPVRARQIRSPTAIMPCGHPDGLSVYDVRWWKDLFDRPVDFDPTMSYVSPGEA
jgi:hypothetical protein